ncbi:GIY-YIG nuclease family protein [Mycoplasmopsis felifaucium]|uniref:GIY-YIG nuclease family protein n=1 Tax=Mycoplasmopsis felifaucium TaxID=35768 RepID=UPI0004862D3D|nr:GIY-YIG nuclease family protein [Mycoplasmopsis felifaucium]
MIKFEDFFNVLEPTKTKVKFNMNAGDSNLRAWDYLMNGENDPDWIEMNSWKKKQANNNLNKAKYLLAFAQYYPYGPDFYIFGGMYKVEKIEPEVFNKVGYKLELMPDFEDYRKRLIIKLERPIGRDIYNKPFENVQRDFNPEVYELAPSTKLGSFPGYNNVLLSHKDLQSIVKMDAPEWKNALSNVKGVYCITDKSTGKLYVGSASGTEGIWQRWRSYANVDNLTGGNKSFEEIKSSDEGYIVDNFSYSILEIFDVKTTSEEIIHREEFWKKVFQTVKYGMNN